MMKRFIPIVLGLAVGLFAGCDRQPSPAPQQTSVPHHEHKPPHHGTPVVLGKEEYHLELVLDAPAGRLQAYILDGELENFVRVPAESFAVSAMLPGKEEVLTFKAIGNNATGEKVGDTALFEAQADRLKTNTAFDAVLRQLTVRGTAYENVTFNFPREMTPMNPRNSLPAFSRLPAVALLAFLLLVSIAAPTPAVAWTADPRNTHSFAAGNQCARRPHAACRRNRFPPIHRRLTRSSIPKPPPRKRTRAAWKSVSTSCRVSPPTSSTRRASPTGSRSLMPPG